MAPSRRGPAAITLSLVACAGDGAGGNLRPAQELAAPGGIDDHADHAAFASVVSYRVREQALGEVDDDVDCIAFVPGPSPRLAYSVRDSLTEAPLAGVPVTFPWGLEVRGRATPRRYPATGDVTVSGRTIMCVRLRRGQRAVIDVGPAP